MNILVIAEVNQNNLALSILNVIMAAKEIGGQISVLVAGNNIAQITSKVAQIDGVSRVFSADAPNYEHNLAEDLSALIVNLVKEHNFSYVLAAATSCGKDYLPRVAALLDCEQISEIIEVIDAKTFVRPIYAGNILATVQSNSQVNVACVQLLLCRRKKVVLMRKLLS